MEQWRVAKDFFLAKKAQGFWPRIASGLDRLTRFARRLIAPSRPPASLPHALTVEPMCVPSSGAITELRSDAAREAASGGLTAYASRAGPSAALSVRWRRSRLAMRRCFAVLAAPATGIDGPSADLM